MYCNELGHILTTDLDDKNIIRVIKDLNCKANKQALKCKTLGTLLVAIATAVNILQSTLCEYYVSPSRSKHIMYSASKNLLQSSCILK